jgi:hypothetical protein
MEAGKEPSKRSSTISPTYRRSKGLPETSLTGFREPLVDRSWRLPMGTNVIPHFKLTESILNQDGLIAKHIDIINTEEYNIIDTIRRESCDIEFIPKDDKVNLVDSEIREINSHDAQVVSIEENSFTIVFQLEIEFRHKYEWKSIDGWNDDEGYFHTYDERDHAVECIPIKGNTQISLDESHSKILEIYPVEFDKSWIKVESLYTPEHMY